MDDSSNPLTPVSNWLAFALDKRINAKLRRAFYQHFPDPVQLGNRLANNTPLASTADPLFDQKANSVLQKPLSQGVQTAIDKALNWASSAPDRHLVGLDNPAYPEQLRCITDAPPLLYVCGKLSTLCQPCVAIVGSRKASLTALDLASELAFELASHGVTIVSGLALGIDAAAHRGALAAGGRTMAVAATPADKIYPRQHYELAEQMLESGAIVSEFALGTTLRAGCFPRRNRLISGLSKGVVVIEAALPSGSLTTAQHALNQGREVMAVPGSTRNPQARGCHYLIRDGAHLVESAVDVLEALGEHFNSQINDEPTCSNRLNTRKETLNSPSGLAKQDSDALTLLDRMGFDPLSVDELVRCTNMSAARTASALTQLELSGDIVPEGVGRYVRCKDRSIR